MTRLDDDFHGWLVDQARVLHSRQYKLLDWEALAEELESMAARERRELKSRLHVLLLHLLKWQAQPDQREFRGRSWKLTMKEARRNIDDLMEDSPSLQQHLSELLEKAYERAREDTVEETGVRPERLPATCPWTFEELMTPDFLPDSPA